MIINHTHKFVFVHVPKCAGTLVRDRLSSFDESGRIDADGESDGGSRIRLDERHIPLATLREVFPERYEWVQNYTSFAMIRDPLERFPSSLSQHVKMFGPDRIEHLSEVEIGRVLEKVIAQLRVDFAERVCLPPEYIHFQRQCDYINDSGRRLVDYVYPTSRVADLLEQIETVIGREVPQASRGSSQKANEAFVYRNETVRRVAEGVRPIVKATFPDEWVLWLGRTARAIACVPRQTRFQHLFSSTYVVDFVREYYVEDMELFRAVKSGNEPRGEY